MFWVMTPSNLASVSRRASAAWAALGRARAKSAYVSFL